MKNFKKLLAKIVTIIFVVAIMYCAIFGSIQIYHVNNYMADAILAFFLISMLSVFPIMNLLDYLETNK